MRATLDIERYEPDMPVTRESCGSCWATEDEAFGSCIGCGYVFCSDCLTAASQGSFCPNCVELAR